MYTSLGQSPGNKIFIRRKTMKKTLALLLAVLMLLSSVAMIAYAEDAQPVAINIEDMPGYEPSYVGGEAIATAPAQDGQIGETEYQYSVQRYPLTYNKLDTDMSTYTNYTTEYYAYDADYIYYAVTNPYWYSAGASMDIRLEHDFIMDANPLVNGSNRSHDDKDAMQLAFSNGNNGTAWSVSSVPEGKTAPTENDIASFLRHDGSYQEGVLEVKISRAYLAAQMGLESAADVTKFTYSTYITDVLMAEGGDWVYANMDHYLTADQMAWLAEQGVETPMGNDAGKLNRVCYMAILGEAPEVPVIDSLEDLYAPTYVGAALGADDAKPVLDGVINENEYQVEYVVTADGALDTARFGVPAALLTDLKQYVAHDDEYFYVAFDFTNASSGLRGRFYWNLSFIDSFNVTYTGGNTVNGAFTQNGNGIADGWFFGAEVKADLTEGYSDRENSVDRGTAPVKGTDFDVAIWKEDVTEPQDEEGNTKTHQVYEFKVSKAWYAAQVGLESAADVRELAWVALGDSINLYGSSYTQIGHYISDADLAALAATGFTYTRPTSSSHPYDNSMLPLLFVLDEDPNAVPETPVIDSLDDLYDPTYVGAPLAPDAAKPVVDSYIRAGEYQVAYVVPAEYNGHAARMGVAANLLDDFTTYVAHDADWVYVAFEFYNGATDGRGRLYWNLSFIDSFNITYGGGSDINTAFLNNGYGIVDGWNFGAEVKADLSEGFSGRNNAVSRGTAPVQGTDFDVAVWKEDLGAEVSATTHQVYEFKFSKAWYAAQVGLESAADVRELAWTNQGAYINEHASSYTQIGHHLTAEDLAALAAAGFNYTVPGTASHPYDNSMLPLLFVLDEDPNGGDATMVPAEDVNQPEEIVIPPASSEIPSTEGTTQPSTTAPSTTTEATTTAAATTTAKATTKAATTAATVAETEAEGKGCKGSIAISALVLVPTLAGGALLLKRRKED